MPNLPLSIRLANTSDAITGMLDAEDLVGAPERVKATLRSLALALMDLTTDAQALERARVPRLTVLSGGRDA